MSHKRGRDKRARDKHEIRKLDRADFQRLLDGMDVVEFILSPNQATAFAKRRGLLSFYVRIW